MSDTHPVYLALGANMGRRRANIEQALQALPPQVVVTAISRLYETEPAYVLDQPVFLNIALKAETRLSPWALLTYLKSLEERIGREKTVRFGPRSIDIDIIFYDQRVIDRPGLQIPHPRMAERSFVLRPLADIAPQAVHPTLHKTVAGLLAELPEEDDGILKVFDWEICET